jgi:VRR-NUC domain
MCVGVGVLPGAATSEAQMSEADLLFEVRKLSGGGCRLFRNNVGVLMDKHGNYVNYGLGVGTSDLIGWQSRVIVPADVGQRFARFVALECKSDTGRVTDEQQAFVDTVLMYGGIARVVRTLDEARSILCY